MSEKAALPAGCGVVRAGAPFVGKQGLSYAPAVSAETVQSSAIHMQLLTIPPGGRGKAHKHEAHETAIYVLSGEGAMSQRAGKRRAVAGTRRDSAMMRTRARVERRR